MATTTGAGARARRLALGALGVLLLLLAGVAAELLALRLLAG